MPTNQLAGNRSHRPRNPKDITGTIYARQHAEQEAKKAAANVDINEVRKAERKSGFEAGYQAGLERGWDLCIAALVEEGVLDPDAETDE